jgi:hypothetical protein
MPSNNRNFIFPVIIIVFSLLTLIKIVLYPPNVYGCLSFIIGTIGVTLFFKRHRKYDAFIYAWIILQAPDIYYINPNGIETPIMNAFPISMFVKLGLGITLHQRTGSTLSLYINIIPIALYYLFKYFNADKPLGADVVINRLKKGTFPNAKFPLKGKIVRLAGMDKVTGVYEVELEEELTLGTTSYKYILLDPRKSIIQTGEAKQICALRTCEMPGMKFHKKRNKFVEWVSVEAC